MSLDKLRKVTAKAKAGSSKPPADEIVPIDEVKFKRWMDSQDLMLEFHISKRTLQNWRRNKEVPYAKLGNKIYYDRTLIEQILQARCVMPNAVRKNK